MSTNRCGKLSGVMAWLRRQRWLRTTYEYLPVRLRERIALSMSQRLQRRLRFPLTAAWASPLPGGLSANGVALDCVQAGKNLPGVNVIGFIRGQFGLGESARAYARALISKGVPVSLYALEFDLAHDWGDRSMEPWIGDDLPHQVSLLFVNPDFWQATMEKVGRERLRDHHVIACWFWELEQVPQGWLPALGDVDELMVSTCFIGEALRKTSDKPVFKVPHPLVATEDSGLQRRDFGLEEGKFILLTSFDFNSWIMRKNPFAAIEAFTKAFPSERDDVRFLIKTSNGFRFRGQLETLLDAAAVDSRILVRDDIIARAHVHALQRCCDVYVSLHRSEGLGLGLAECMAHGKPVIATAWSGNMDFMTADSACLVDYVLVPVSEGEYPCEPGSTWAEANVETAATWMRRLADDASLRREIGERAKASVMWRMAPEVAAISLIDHMREVSSRSGAKSRLAANS